MTTAEAQALKDLLHGAVDKSLPEFISAESAKLPVAYAPLVGAITAALVPTLITFLDGLIEADIVATPVAPAAAPAAAPVK